MDPLPQASYSHVTLEEPAATGSSPMTVTARRYPTPEEGLLRLSRIEGPSNGAVGTVSALSIPSIEGTRHATRTIGAG